VEELPDYDPAMLIPKKMTAAELHPLLAEARALLAGVTPFTQDSLERSLRSLADTKGVKAGQFFTPIRVAVCGRAVAPPLFGTLEVLGRERVLGRVDLALDKIALLAANS
jgi:glutamyl-tRNA synthetase